MTTEQLDPEGSQTGATDEGVTQVTAIETGAQGAAQETTAEEDAADALLMAGYNAAKTGDRTGIEPAVEADKKSAAKTGNDDDEPGAGAAALKPADKTATDDDFQAKVDARFATLEKSAASANGLAGHLKQQLATLAKGKPITKENLTRVREEFGDEYAEALASDLTAAGIGGGAVVDETKIGELVEARVETVKREMHRDRVLDKHEDAGDYFNGGKHNAAFSGWIKTLPEERQAVLADSWDARVINSALTEFKTHVDKAAKSAARQNSRVARGVVPTTGAAADNAPPAVDPLMQGWQNVKGKPKTSAATRG